MALKKHGNRAGKTLSTLANVISCAYDNGEISSGLYNELVKVGVQDRRQEPESENTWNGFEASPPPEVIEEVPYEEYDVPAPVADDCEPEPIPCAEDCEPVSAEEDPPSPPSPLCEAEVVEDEVVEEKVVEEVESQEPTLTSRGEKCEQYKVVPEHKTSSTTQLKKEYGARDNKEGGMQSTPGKRSNLFRWCTTCRRMQWVTSDERNLLEEVSPGMKLEEGILLFHCRTCMLTHGPNGASQADRNRECDSWSSEPTSQAEALCINPVVWRGTEAWEIARIVMGREVAVLGEGCRRTIWKTFEALKNSIIGDRILSVDVEGFRAGKRTDLLLPYLEGGFS